jgi:tRNA pseudouridine synthase 10
MDPAREGEAAGRALLPAALAASEGWEFRTYLVGTRPPAGLEGSAADEFRRAANRTLGTLLAQAWEMKRLPEFTRPEAHVFARVSSGSVEVVVAPLTVYGRYRKNSRALAQTPFHCPLCRGRGCGNCGGTGRMVPGSVAELLVPLLVDASGAEAGVFKGCGREDADVRMLGSGRPFVATLSRPRRRSLDFDGIRARADADAKGEAEFPVLYAVANADGEAVPATHPPKSYEARVEVEGGATPEDCARLAAALAGVPIAQRTPRRVARRRADLVRTRSVLGAEARLLDDGALSLRLRAEAGTYIKELISGDEGRTVPSASSILGRPCRCAALDVLEIELPDPPRIP